MGRKWHIWSAGLGLLVGVAQVDTQELQSTSPRESLRQCRSNINANPTDGQRLCRDAINNINMDPTPEQYQQEKVEAFSLLGESYFKVGRIADAMAHLDSVKVLTSEEDPNYRKAVERQEEIDRLFRPLRIKIKDRDIPRLAYIEGMDLTFRFSNRLEKGQINRLRILQDMQSHKEDEFQFVGVDEDGRPYMEIEYFPVITFPGRTMGYSLIVENKRRYGFNFTAIENKPLEIYWEDDAGWRLIERVPDSMAKVELPAKYSFKTTEYLVLSRGDTAHYYLPAEAETELILQGSREKNWERAYDLALYVITGAAVLLGLWGAR